MTTVGMVGLGQMGNAMTEALLREGFAVVGTDLDADKRAAAAELGAQAVETVAGVCEATDVIILSLPEARHVEAVVAGPGGILELGQAGSLVIDATTSEPEVSRKLAAEMAGAGHAFIDAPVSGGTRGARAGTLAVMVGGAAADFERARPVLAALSAKLSHIGPAGAGNVVKLVNNLMGAAHLVIAAEGARLAELAGVPAAELLEVVNAGSGRSLMTETVMPEAVLTGASFGFSAALMRKDVRLALELADQVGAELPVCRVNGGLWAETAEKLAPDADFTEVGARVLKDGKL